MASSRTRSGVLGALAVLAFVSCAKRETDSSAAGSEQKAAQPVSSEAAVISIDGSSTVFPITEAVAEEFRVHNPAKVTIGVSGTGGGFKKFCGGETAISGASRPIKPTEVQLCKDKGIEYVELPVAYDGIAVVVNGANDWANSMTVAELKALFRPEAQNEVKRWSQVRTGWPDQEIHLFGAGVDSGTYDYFTAAIVGTEHASRGDFTSSEDDNVLVQGVAMDKLALGFFGYAYYKENAAKLRVVGIDDEKDDNGKGPITPSPSSVIDGSYSPLSRPIFIYLSRAALERSEVDTFARFYIEHAPTLVGEVGYISLPPRAYELALRRLSSRVVGSVFGGSGSRVGVSVEALLAAE
ncbi:MAG TPA: PstS family phosphate ABC transporter substrate-binding protein [Polyangiaceae bacterium]|nr:PstS family phosphate ABC transporter substrate-binding protein [Polyangiaceae bacterium]